MILITGGAYQGKLKFAESICEKKEPVIVHGEQAKRAELERADIITDFHLYIRRLMKEETEEKQEVKSAVKELILKNPEVILEIHQLGCGVVPIDSFERSYREQAGRVGCMLAEQAESVYLVHCGIARKLK